MEPIVSVSEGTIRGSVCQDLNGGTFYGFLGVPYGKPPIGPLRFKAPLPADPWDGVKDCTKDGSRCYFRDIVTNEYGGSEDCLVLNIFTKSSPQHPTDLKPVMFWLYGGGFIIGSNETSSFGPEHLLTEDIVLVTINYRLGILGFLSLEDPSLEIPGNAGLKDQLLALKWVQKNIKLFGGDPNNVTVFGESAGAASVHFHVLSEQSKGLFHRAILQSGVVLNPWSWGTAGCKNFVEKMGRGNTVNNEQETLDVLRGLAVEELYKIQELCYDDIIPNLRRPFGPVLEQPNSTAFLTEDPVEVIKSGKYNKVPMIIGYNSLEGMFVEGGHFFFPKTHKPSREPKECIPWNMAIAGDGQCELVGEQLDTFYRAAAGPNEKYNLETDSLFLTGILAAIQYHLKTTEAPIYLYRFAFDGGLNVLKPILQNYSSYKLEGACHADELGYLFKNIALPNCQPDTEDWTTLKRFVKLWTNFAKCGNPTPDEGLDVVWKNVEDEKLQFLDFGTDLVMRENPEKERMDFWKQLCNASDSTRGYLL